MKNIWHIFTDDLNNIRKNWVAFVIIIGLIILPSLYAWINIKASWDPYSQTDQIPVGVVNEDEGATIRDEVIHVGDELITTLRENDSFDWHFTSYDEALDKVDYGDFYAVLVIPRDFSTHLSTVIESKPEKATVEYYVNEKINAISPKITEKGASVIVEQISSQFISTVNGVIFEIFNEIGLEIEEELPDIRQVEKYIFAIEEKLPDIYETLNDSFDHAERAHSIIQRVQNQLPRAKALTKNTLQAIDDIHIILNQAEDHLTDLSPTMTEKMNQITEVINEINQFIETLQETDLQTDLASEINDVEKVINEIITKILTIENSLAGLIDLTENEERSSQFIDLLDELSSLKEELESLKDPLLSLESFFEEHMDDLHGYTEDIQQKSEDMITNTEQFIHFYEDTVEPTLFENIHHLQENSQKAKERLKTIDQRIPEIEQMMKNTEDKLSEGQRLLDQGLNQYPIINDKVTHLADRIRKVKEETDIHEIIDLLKNDPEAEKNFFAEPVVLNENRVYPVQNYGTGMTPFYTVLAMWVGVVLLISLLSVDVGDQSGLTARHIYFGKLLTFLVISILQTLIVTIGDVTLIGVKMSSPIWFILFGMIISLTFTTVIYTVVSVFGDVGKAIAIIMLVLQIASSGGTYPVVLLPDFFQWIHPFLPFTYAVDLMREAVGGIIWLRAFKNIMALFVMSLLFIGFAFFAKEPFNKRSKKLMEKSKEAGLFQ